MGFTHHAEAFIISPTEKSLGGYCRPEIGTLGKYIFFIKTIWEGV